MAGNGLFAASAGRSWLAVLQCVVTSDTVIV